MDLKEQIIKEYLKQGCEYRKLQAKYRRRHSSLNWQVPDEVHKQSGIQKKTWKNYYYKRSKNSSNNATA